MLVCAGAGAPANAGGKEVPSGLVGAFVYAGGAGERELLDASIEQLVGKMSFLFRSIARSRLRAGNQPVAQIEISLPEQGLTIARGSEISWSLAANNREATFTNPAGLEVVVRRRIEGNVLVEEIDSNETRRTNRYGLRDGGRVLTFDVVIASPDLPTQLTYSFHYRRE